MLGLTKRIDDLAAQGEGQQTALRSLEERVAELARGAEAMATSMAETLARLDGAEATAASMAEALARLDARIASLEPRLEPLEDRIASVEAAASARQSTAEDADEQAEREAMERKQVQMALLKVEKQLALHTEDLSRTATGLIERMETLRRSGA